MNQKISAIMIVYNEEKVIERALESIKGVVDEILIFHDGPCLDDTLKIAKKYTKKVFGLPRKGRSGLHLIDAIKKTKNDWVLKIDADEFLSEGMKKNINRLAQKQDVSAYLFKWLIWDGKKYISENWPHKKVMYKKSKVSFYEFPGKDEPETSGKEIKTDYLLEHKPGAGKNDTLWSWKDYWDKGINRYGKSQAEWTLKEFKDLRKWQCKRNKYPLTIRVRRNFPLLSAIPFGIMAFLKEIFSGAAWKEGNFVIRGAFRTGLYYIWLGGYIFKLKYWGENK